jgi:copper chaperone CopZ
MSYSITLSIPKIHCGGCVKTIKEKTQALPGVINVEGDAVARTASYVLESKNDLPRLKQELVAIGFPAAA